MALDLIITQVPAAVLRDQPEGALPALRLGDTHHPSKETPVGPYRENRRGENPVEMRVRIRMVEADDVHRGARVLLPQVRFEPALPVRMPQADRGTSDYQLAGNEEVVGHGIGGQVREVAQRE